MDLDDFRDLLNLVLAIWAFGIGLRFLLSLTEARMLGGQFSLPPHPGNFVIDFGPLVIMGGAAIVLNLWTLMRSRE